MELRQLRYFVRVVELGSMGRAATDLQLVQSTLSQQISRLEGELAASLLQRSKKGVTPTDAGLAFYREAQLALRHVDQAGRAAQQSRIAGLVSVALSPSATAVLGLPFLVAMRERYPNINVRVTETFRPLRMLNARLADMAVLFQPQRAVGMTVIPLVREKLFLFRPVEHVGPRPAARMRVAQLKGVPLVVNIGPGGLREVLDAAFAKARIKPTIVAEIDSLPMLLDAISAGLGAGLLPWAYIAREHEADRRFHLAEITDASAHRNNWLCSLADSELSPAALGARVVFADVARERVRSGKWKGVDLLRA
jgi:LysR family transcriptional regulator, regulatory protein for tcuABC